MTANKQDAAELAMKEWPICVHPRLGLGAAYDDIGRWFGKHANTVYEILKDAARQNAGAVDVDDLSAVLVKMYRDNLLVLRNDVEPIFIALWLELKDKYNEKM